MPVILSYPAGMSAVDHDLVVGEVLGPLLCEHHPCTVVQRVGSLCPGDEESDGGRTIGVEDHTTATGPGAGLLKLRGTGGQPLTAPS